MLFRILNQYLWTI